VPESALDNPLILPILGLLVERPRHPYAIFAGLRRRYLYLHVRNATVYTLLDTLKAVRWIEAREDAGRESLHATGSGAAATAERVEVEVRGGDLTGGPSYMTALAYLSIMTPERAADALHARVSALADEVQRLSGNARPNRRTRGPHDRGPPPPRPAAARQGMAHHHRSANPGPRTRLAVKPGFDYGPVSCSCGQA
jgi:DNA-binding PadR family transcriptional regulator